MGRCGQGVVSGWLPRMVLVAEACFFFSSLPKATVPLKSSSAPLAANLQRNVGILLGLSETNNPNMATNRSRNLGKHRGQGVSLAKVAFPGGSRAGLPRTVPIVEACFFFFLGFQRQRSPQILLGAFGRKLAT